MSKDSQRIEIDGLSISQAQDIAKQLGVIGTASIKASKVAALVAVLMGASTEDTSKSTLISESILRRIAAVARGNDAAKITKALRSVDWAKLAEGDKDAVYGAAHVWDDFLTEVASAPRSPMSPSDLAILIHNAIVNADNPVKWITAVNDALESAAATIAAKTAEPSH